MREEYNEELGEIRLEKNWRIAFDFFPTSVPTGAGNWNSFLHLRDGEGDYSRVLGFWFVPKSLTPRFGYETLGCVDDVCHPFDYTELNLNQWNIFVISQTSRHGKYYVNVNINGVQYPEFENTAPQVYQNLDVLNSGPHYRTPSGRFRGLTIRTTSDDAVDLSGKIIKFKISET